MTDTSALGDRMKGYEAVTRAVLPRRTYTILRVDGRSFHSYLRSAEKPFDYRFMDAMGEVAAVLCKEVSGSVFAYLQSDEISVLLTDFGSVHTEPWFGGVVQKMASIAASTASVTLNRIRYLEAAFDAPAMFDARVFTIPGPVEVANYFLWRQRDALRNSVSMAAQAHFSHKRLQGLNGNQMQELLWQERKVNWNDYPAQAKRGSVCVREVKTEDVPYLDKKSGTFMFAYGVQRTYWECQPAPDFLAAPDTWLAGMIPAMPGMR